MKAHAVRSLTLLSVLLLAVTFPTARPLKKTTQQSGVLIEIPNNESDRPFGSEGLFMPAQADTYLLAEYDFDVGGMCDPQGWVGVDVTAQDGTFFHVDNYRVILGNQSLWCGVRPDANQEPFCMYNTLPGYGNEWKQYFESTVFHTTGDVTLSYYARFDSEPPYDSTYVEYSTDGGGTWTILRAFNGAGDSLVSDVITDPDSISFRFYFTSDNAWSDEDGLWDTEGAIIIDSLTVTDGTGVVDYQDFESEALGDTVTTDGDWWAYPLPGFGDFSGLFPGELALQEDECTRDISCLWGFFKGSTYDYSCGGHPEQQVVPFMNERGQVIMNYIKSPWIEWNPGSAVPPSATGAIYDFYVYLNLPLDNLIFYSYAIRCLFEGSDCPGTIRWYDGFYYGSGPEWRHSQVDMGPLVSAGATHVQLMLFCRDMCPWWCGVYGTGTCHSHAPLFDRVKLYRVEGGPRWMMHDAFLFQDNFPTNGTTSGTVRADIAYDLLNSKPQAAIRPGDSLVATVYDNYVGLGLEPYLGTGKAAVYAYVKATPTTHNTGSPMSGDLSRWEYVGPAGDGWHQFLCDSAYSGYGGPVPDKFCFDLNDTYFTPPDRIDFYLSATDANGLTTYWSQFTGLAWDEAVVRALPMEMQCLPGGGGLLYVDDFDNRGAQPYFDSAFGQMSWGSYWYPDRYDVRAPSSMIGNGLGARATAAQITDVYSIIIWNSGDLRNGTIGDGTGSPGKSPDAQLLFSFLDQTTVWNPMIYFSGDNIAEEWKALASTPIQQLETYIPFHLISGDHIAAGHKIAPLVIKAPTAFTGYSPDTMVAYGGCPMLNDFDVLEPTGISAIDAYYDPTPTHGAVIHHEKVNAQTKTSRVVFSGFSYHMIRDDRPVFPFDRLNHLRWILKWSEHWPDGDPVGIGDEPAFTNSLAQNYPNPFNPVTTIAFSLKERAHVSLAVYDVAGRLVRALLDEERIAGMYTDVKWNGINGRGEEVSSGVYFYKLVTKGFSDTKKMVLLK